MDRAVIQARSTARHRRAVTEYVESGAFDLAQRPAIQIEGDAHREPAARIEQRKSRFGRLVKAVNTRSLHAHQSC